MKLRFVLPALFAAAMLVGCQAHPTDADANQAKAVAHIKPVQGQTVKGDVWFFQRGDSVKVVAELEGLPPNSTHGFHIHEKGDLSAPDLSSAGAHYNPDAKPHAGMDTEMRHAGDFGNVKSDASGRVHFEAEVTNISVNGKTNPVVGRSVIVHAKADDLKTQPSGDSGARIGGGVIELSK